MTWNNSGWVNWWIPEAPPPPPLFEIWHHPFRPISNANRLLWCVSWQRIWSQFKTDSTLSRLDNQDHLLPWYSAIMCVCIYVNTSCARWNGFVIIATLFSSENSWQHWSFIVFLLFGSTCVSSGRVGRGCDGGALPSCHPSVFIVFLRPAHDSPSDMLIRLPVTTAQTRQIIN